MTKGDHGLNLERNGGDVKCGYGRSGQGIEQVERQVPAPGPVGLGAGVKPSGGELVELEEQSTLKPKISGLERLSSGPQHEEDDD